MHSAILLESWRKTWRDGFAPLLSTRALEALRVALVTDSPELIQGETTTPLGVPAVLDWPCEAACAVSFGPWKADHLETVEEVESRFAHLCNDADKRLGEPGAIRYFTNFWDATPRDVARQELLAEVCRELEARLPRLPPAAA